MAYQPRVRTQYCLSCGNESNDKIVYRVRIGDTVAICRPCYSTVKRLDRTYINANRVGE
jgi:hypothetical protein